MEIFYPDNSILNIISSINDVVTKCPRIVFSYINLKYYLYPCIIYASYYQYTCIISYYNILCKYPHNSILKWIIKMHLSPHKYTLMTRPRVSINAVFARWDIYNMRTLTSMKIECFWCVTLYILVHFGNIFIFCNLAWHHYTTLIFWFVC